ncbi:MAG: hypothetical protein ACD_16C00100G0063 [uncultured bacterium]|nr:MAG: hypothetical protein ACD_16C00100G0063 [uncultured bacterium]OFW68070.1 MAG: hypothetical protein A2X70_05130 [Alphaproteobacteria bacterium GWC2_42_16]OFW73460.1 MAG: hypothetical protein A2Z80_06430 [Alphaproteobacteria bacterium GWA2_41_27]OFW82310.1 MAG: hypothetical protein A3E50_03830 [Alphaproteobacteria bacterium RIFCSPHIGHO2_12_FULL_42_100]OFW86136.1 MAG: hypothetical protein A2W06_00760 [Alphaproteobacteria bacterium RBG_16_42_14]OFW91696.1 MAG: hypothetical protein A3C41_008
MKRICLILGFFTPLALQATPLTLTCSHGTIFLEVEVAQTSQERDKGLMFRADLADDGGMLFLFPAAQKVGMWMKDTPLSLDMIFANSKGEILAIHENTTPFSTKTIGPVANTAQVLEIKAGTIKKLGITRDCVLSSLP